MHNVIQPAPRFMAQTPIFVAGTAEAGDSISGVQDGDYIVGMAWGDGGMPSTPSGYTSRFTGTVGILRLNVYTKTASSESGTWPGTSGDSNRSTLYLWVRNAAGTFAIGTMTGGTVTDFELTSITMASNGIIIANACVQTSVGGSGGVNFDDTDFAGWSSDIKSTYGGASAPRSELKYRKLGPTTSGTFTVGQDSTTVPIAGILIHVA